MAGGRVTYWEKSCPKCGKPSDPTSRIADNKVIPNSKGKVSRKVRCRKCKGLLFRIAAIITILLLVCGCHWFEDNRIPVNQSARLTAKIDTSSYEFRRILAIMIKSRYKTEAYMDVNWIMADLELAEYKQSLKKEGETK